MPQASRGRRQALTVRLPFDEYREVCIRAQARRWSVSDYVGYCVAREIAGRHKVKTQPAPNAEATFRRFDGVDDG